ncbi:MAG: chromate transporter, partial [Clostridia bacterium]
MILAELFFSFLQVGLFSIGGGYAALPLIQHQVVEAHTWLTMSEFTDLITIAEMTPGPIAVNSATFVGIRIAGVGGALIATLGCILPSMLIVSMLAYVY